MSYDDFADKIRDRLGIEIEPVMDWPINNQPMYFGPSHKPQPWQTNNKKSQVYKTEYKAEWTQPLSVVLHPVHTPQTWLIAQERYDIYHYKDFEDKIKDRLG